MLDQNIGQNRCRQSWMPSLLHSKICKDCGGFGPAKAQKGKKNQQNLFPLQKMDICAYDSWRKPSSTQKPKLFLSFFHVLFLTTKEYLNCAIHPRQWINNSFPWDEPLWLDGWTQILWSWNGRNTSILCLLMAFHLGLIRNLFQEDERLAIFFSVSCRHVTETGYRWIMEGLWRRWVVWLRFDTLLCFLLKHISNKMQRGIYISWEFDPRTL